MNSLSSSGSSNRTSSLGSSGSFSSLGTSTSTSTLTSTLGLSGFSTWKTKNYFGIKHSFSPLATLAWLSRLGLGTLFSRQQLQRLCYLETRCIKRIIVSCRYAGNEELFLFTFPEPGCHFVLLSSSANCRLWLWRPLFCNELRQANRIEMIFYSTVPSACLSPLCRRE